MLKEYSAISWTQEIADMFVASMTKHGLVSDEVLFSSIGESRCREWAVENCEDPYTVEYISNDNNWKRAVLIARYGEEKGVRKYMTEHLDIDPGLVDQFFEVVDTL